MRDTRDYDVRFYQNEVIRLEGEVLVAADPVKRATLFTHLSVARERLSDAIRREAVKQ